MRGFAVVVVVSMVCVCLGFMVSLSLGARMSPSRQKLEVQKHLNRLNKPAVKTIQVHHSLSLSLSLYFSLHALLLFGFPFPFSFLVSSVWVSGKW